MSIKKALIKNTSLNLFGYLYLLVASFFSISVLLHHLGRDVLGVYFLLSSVIPLSTVIDFGFGTAIVRKLSLPQTTPAEKIRIWQTGLAFYLLMSAILTVCVFVIFTYLSNTIPILRVADHAMIKTSILFLSLTTFFNYLNNHFLNLSQAEQRFDIYNLKTFLVGSGNTLFSAILVTKVPDMSALFGLQFSLHVVTTIALVTYAIRVIPTKSLLPKIHFNILKSLFHFGLRDFVGSVSNQIEAQFSKYALGTLVSAQAVTAFTIPQSIILKGAGVFSQIAIAFFPFSASLLHKDRIHKLAKTIFGVEILTFIGGVFTVFCSFSFGRLILTWWLKDPVVVELGVPVLNVLSIYFVLTSLTPIPTVVMESLDHPQIPSLFALLTTVIEIVTIFVLVPHYGLIGVAYATLLSASITVPSFLIVFSLIYFREVKKIQSLA